MSTLFRKEALDTQRERLWGDVILIQPVPFYVLTGAACLIVAVAAAFLVFGHYSRRESVTGYLEPDRGLVKIYADTPGTIVQAHAAEGDQVRQGDILFTISTARNTAGSSDVDALILAELEKSKEKYASQLTQQTRLNQLEQEDLEERVDGLKDELDQLETELSVRKRQVEVSRERLDSVKDLLNRKYISLDQYKDLQERALNSQLALEETKRLRIGKTSALTELTNQLGQLPMKSYIGRANLEQSIAGLNQKLEEIKGRRVYAIRAPIAGRVTAQQAQTGQAAKQNMPLMALLPENATLDAQLFVPTRAIGFIQPGQRVLLQYAAFPYQRFGLYEGNIVTVTETILSPAELPVPVTLQEPVYRVTVRPQEQFVSAYGRKIPLQAGMLLEADIILEKRTLSQWLLDPVQSLFGRL